MMTTFDYARAWYEVARPAYESLPANLRDLLARVATEAGELHQQHDLSMPWPADSDLRAAFDKVPAEYLALASRVIYNVGHWYPSWGDLEVPCRGAGAHWKFSHYADQSLRVRLGLPEADRYHAAGVGLAVHEGAIRVWYSSRHCWTRIEVAPATVGGEKYARETIIKKISSAIEKYPHADVHKRDSAAYEAFETIKGDRAGFEASGSLWWPLLVNTDRYMVAEGDQMPPPANPDRDRTLREKQRNGIIERAEAKINGLTRERDGLLWLLDHCIETENVIYYDHTDRFSFGWRAPVGPVLLSRILNVISEFPYRYEIKTADGRTLQNE